MFNKIFNFKNAHQNIKYILHPIFILSLIILLLNDFYLKTNYSNWITGKLSDVFGIIVFTLFWSVFIAEKHRKLLFIVVAIVFIYWKSEWSNFFIEFWNINIPNFKIQRVIDYTDLICLIILIPIYCYNFRTIKFTFKKELVTYPLMGVTIFAILATSRAKKHFGNEIYIDDFMTLKLDRNQFLNQLNNDKILYTNDSVFIFHNDTFERFVLTHIILEKDTIHSAIIGVKDNKNKLKIYIEKITISKDYTANKFDDYKKYKAWKSKYKVETENFFEKLDD